MSEPTAKRGAGVLPSTRAMSEAFGKVIVLGEHAVVYGLPAIAAGIAPGISARAHRRPGPMSLQIAPWQVSFSVPGDDSPLGRALTALVQAGGGELTGVQLEAVAHLPAGGGLGSSAALGVALARALWPEASLEAIDHAVHAFESVFHGTPSGIDGHVAARGGLLLYRRGEPSAPIAAKCPLPVCIGDSGERGSTHEQVAKIRAQRECDPGAAAALDAIGALVLEARAAIEDGDLVRLGALMSQNHARLAALGVSTPKLEQMCELAQSAGALGVKLTGAGGGGAVIALSEHPERIAEAWSQAGFRAMVTHLS